MPKMRAFSEEFFAKIDKSMAIVQSRAGDDMRGALQQAYKVASADQTLGIFLWTSKRVTTWDDLKGQLDQVYETLSNSALLSSTYNKHAIAQGMLEYLKESPPAHEYFSELISEMA